MTAYSIAEQSVESAQPVELYKFEYGAVVYTYTSSDTAITHAGLTYQPEPISRTEAELSRNMNKSLMKLSATKNNEVVQVFTPGALAAKMFITIFRQHSRVSDSDFIVLYKGRVTSCSLAEMQATLTCEPIFTSLKRMGLRRTYEPSCPLMLYSAGCKVNKSLFLVSGPVSAFDGRKQLTVPVAAGKPSGWFNGGVIIINGKPHMVSDHVSSTITLMRHMQGESIVGDVSLYPGCDHTRATCATKFTNIENYGGFPWMAFRNPFSGDSVQWISG